MVNSLVMALPLSGKEIVPQTGSGTEESTEMLALILRIAVR
jgi:hypothetical protein